MKNFEELYRLMGEFSLETFSDATSVEHLKKLKIEADEAIIDNTKEEYADCFLCLIAAAYKNNISPEEFLKSSFDKLEIIKKRNWSKTSDGLYQHIKP